MYSDNQILDISGSFRQLNKALKFALDFSENKESDICYQVVGNKYCIGWLLSDGEAPKGWRKYPFTPSVAIIEQIIMSELIKMKYEPCGYEYGDGSCSKGFRMRCLEDSPELEDEGIENPFYGIVSIEPYTNYYGK